jgi:hypothetical protein
MNEVKTIRVLFIVKRMFRCSTTKVSTTQIDQILISLYVFFLGNKGSF